MNDTFKKFGFRRGLSLAEVLAAIVVGSMVLVSLLGIYNRAERATAAVNRTLDSSRLPGEILQRIAEDIDKVISAGAETRITIEPGYQNGYRGSKMTIVRTIKDSKNKDVTLEEIIWQSYYDIESDMEGLVLYRGHSGISLEDKLLDEQRADWEKGYPMVPICSGVTLFEITVPSGENVLEKWTSEAMPKGIIISISFSEPVQVSSADSEIPDEYKTTRTIAVDRTRTIKFDLAKIEAKKGNTARGSAARDTTARDNAAPGNSGGRTESE